MTYKLLVASVVDTPYSVLPKVAAVTGIFEHQGFDYRPKVDIMWHGWASKLRGFIEAAQYAASSGEFTHFMFVDGADVVPLAGPDGVMERFLELDHPWVFAAEPNIWSQNSFRPEDYPTPNVVYRYLNSGASLGEIDHILHWFNVWTKDGTAIPLSLPRGDQDWVAARFIESYPDAIKIDCGCELFQCMCGSLVPPYPHCTVMPGKVINHITGTEPLVIHFNGGDDITSPSRRILWQYLI